MNRFTVAPSPSWTAGFNGREAFTLRGGGGDVEFIKTTFYDADLELGPHDALVAPRRTGICGSDIHFYKHGRVGDYKIETPLIMGHEAAGVVLAVGRRVKDLAPGDLVALEPGQTCGVCSVCKDGKYELCSDMVFASTPPHDGTLQSTYRLSAHLCYKLPANMTLEEGALIEPLAVAVHAAYRIGNIRPNQNVAIFGAGPIGLLTMAACKALGARRIIAIDVQADRLEFAKSYAATDTFLPPEKQEAESVAEYCKATARSMMGQLQIPDRGLEGINLIIECSGAEVCLQTAVHIAEAGGTIVQVGLGAEISAMPAMTLLFKQLRYLGSFRYGAGVYQTAIDLVSQGKIALAPLITHQYSFADADKYVILRAHETLSLLGELFTDQRRAFAAMVSGKGYDGKAPIKIIIDGPKWNKV